MMKLRVTMGDIYDPIFGSWHFMYFVVLVQALQIVSSTVEWNHQGLRTNGFVPFDIKSGGSRKFD